MEDIKNNQLIIKSNNLIQASYRLTLQEQRIVLLLASLIEYGDKDFKKYQISVQDFKKITGVSGTGGYSEIKEITKKLLTRVTIIKDIDNRRELQVNWLSSAEYFEGEGYIELEFSPKLKPYLLDLKERFTTYKLHYVFNMKSTYSIRFYELLKQYEKIGKIYYTLIDLRKILGIADNEYNHFGHFRERILDKARKEIINTSDLHFDYKENRRGRKIIGIDFFITRKNDFYKTNENINNTSCDEDIKQILQQYFSLSPSQAQDALNFCPDKEEMKLIISHVERKHKAGEINDLPGYTIYAIKKRVKDQISLFETELREKERQKKIEEEKNRLEAERIKKLTEIFNAELKNKALALFEQLNEEMQELLIKACEASLDQFSLKMYEDKGRKFEGPSLEIIFSLFLKAKLLSAEQRNFDLWLKNQS